MLTSTVWQVYVAVRKTARACLLTLYSDVISQQSKICSLVLSWEDHYYISTVAIVQSQIQIIVLLEKCV